MLQKNKSYANGNFDDYINYLNGIKNKLPASLYEFAVNSKRHDLQKDSMHDSWLQSVSISSDFKGRTASIQLVFLGAYHDREFHLNCTKVRQYKIIQNLQDTCRDLISFEVMMDKNIYNEEQIVFRALFANDELLEVFCDDLTILEKFIKP